VAVRLTGGDDITPEVTDFMSSYGVRGYPTLYVMNAAGHVVVSKVNRTVDAMLAALAEGDAAELKFAELKAKTDPAGKKAYRDALKSRMAWGDVAAMLEADVKAAPSAEAYGELAGIYASCGRAADERATLEKALGLYKAAKDRTAWRIRLATMDHDVGKAKSREEADKRVEASTKALEALLAKMAEEKDVAGSAQVHAAIGATLQRMGKADDAEKHFDAALAADPKGRSASTSLMGKANCAWARKDWAGCKAQLEKILAEFPDSDEAKNAPKGVENCDKKMEAEKK
jgi:tetratricopeptide (TPR) repeat protein